ncbi:MAG TPA: hypothetical protein VF450_17835 [Noviherbaspirillum sp.]
MEIQYLSAEQWANLMESLAERDRAIDEKIKRGELPPDCTHLISGERVGRMKIQWNYDQLMSFRL